MVVTRYEIIKALGDDFEDLVILDIVSRKMLNWLEYYESYTHKMETYDNKRLCLRTVAEEHNITERTLYKIITFMETG